MMHRNPLWGAAIVAVVCVSVNADARRVESTFAGKIVILKKNAPPRFRSDGAFQAFLRKNRVKSLWTNHDQGWRINFFAFFRKPLRDVEVKVRFYDVTQGRHLVASDSIFHSARGQRILYNSNFVLDKNVFKPNKRYMMYLVNARNVVLASAPLKLGGKTERYSGRVVFSEPNE